MNELYSFLESISSKSDFDAELSRKGGYITFSNSGRRGGAKFFQIGIENIIQTLQDILNHLDVFQDIAEYEEKAWRDNGAEYFTDPVANANSTVQTKPLFSTLSKIIIWANQPVWDKVNPDKLMALDRISLQTTINKLQMVSESFTPVSTLRMTTTNNFLQQIFYGAPGTGKSHTVKRHTEGESVVRTTFHPDSDYSTFVGCYKPTTKQVAMRDVTGKIIVENDGTQVTEDRIVYEFVDQAFLQAYIKAWKFYAEAAEGAEPKKQYLIIEEINRGNCAQIFGDLFQLLDRNGYGFSDYYIHADKDMQKHLSKAFNNIDIDESHRNAINSLYPKDGDVVAKVLSGEILLLPDNLYIWATMNTSDQSLFPIDSAFKRRWDWEYEPIKYKNTNWVIDINGNKFSWVSFQREINKRIFDATSSEDKMLGDYFVNPADGIVTEKILLNKILFYLWNDVCKEGEGDIFKVSETEDVTFSELHGEGGSENLVAMMKYLGVSSVNNTAEDDLNEEPIDQESNTWYQNLWADVRNNLSNKGLENVPAPRERQTYQLGVGLTGISVLANVPRTKANGYVGYYIEKQQASDIYPKLLTLKNAIEDKLGELDWHREGDRYAVVKRRLDLNGINDDSLRIGLVENLSTLLVDFKETILPLIDQLR